MAYEVGRRQRAEKDGTRHDEPGQQLPREVSDRLTNAFSRFLQIETASGLLLLLALLTALGFANSPWSTSFLAFWEMPIGLHFGPIDFSRSLRHWINDGVMTFFFFVVALELKREIVLGELRDLRTAALPFAGALGGMIVPVCLYLALTSGQPAMHGWGTVMATDTAFAIACLALFGSRIPASLRLFLISLAIFDDVGAILVVAVGYGEALNWVSLALGVLGLAAVACSACLGIRSVPVYFLLGVSRSNLVDRRDGKSRPRGSYRKSDDEDLLPLKNAAVREMARVVRPGGTIALYVWDYAGHMQVMRTFFDVATALDPKALEYDDGVKAPICRPGPLSDLLERNGLLDVEVRAIDVPAAFDSFEDYWSPFLGGTGSAPRYCASLENEAREHLKSEIQRRLPIGPDGEILLAIRAWAAKGMLQ